MGFQEVFTIVKGLKRGNGPNNTINEMLKYGWNGMVEVLCSLVSLVMESGYWSNDWRQSYMCHSLKLGMRRQLVIIEDSSGVLCGKVMTRTFADRLS